MDTINNNNKAESTDQTKVVSILDNSTSNTTKGSNKYIYIIIASVVFVVIVAAGITYFTTLNKIDTRPNENKIVKTDTVPSLVEEKVQVPKDTTVGKRLLAENDRYSVYLLSEVTKDDGTSEGDLVVSDKTTKSDVKIDGKFTISGETILISDKDGKYILLSTGTYSSRTIIPISLEQKKQVTKDFCSSSAEMLFFNDVVIYNNCDIFTNRPWGAGEAPSIVALNLLTDKEEMLIKSDLTHQYRVTKIEGNIMYYKEESVAKEADWNDQAKQKSADLKFDLSKL